MNKRDYADMEAECVDDSTDDSDTLGESAMDCVEDKGKEKENEPPKKKFRLNGRSLTHHRVYAPSDAAQQQAEDCLFYQFWLPHAKEFF